ncbi:T9SS type A sorting domain-containing protein [Xanthocytophaga flava]|uniref:T9SS type A sorting domain-containing protein n=1 Tax=Xanthocytophaga flava TaxID=3048013 RepID=UPI0028D8659D|nr:T9SS type A sorting domain-containing protein [Xanthocytophaga flavus]MDJ1472544.1 T9SS type A sorting domain-containing protein [Xanthocytophaga flavus]
MRRIVLWALAFVWVTALYAQDVETGEYAMDFTIKIWGSNYDDRCTNRFDIYTTYNNGSAATSPIWMENVLPLTSPYRTIFKSIPVAANKRLTTLRIYGERQWHNAFNCKGVSGNSSNAISYTACYRRTFTNIIPEWNSELELYIHPKAINLYYFDRIGQKQTYGDKLLLPQAHRIQIKATQGFPDAVYGWQYQIGNGTWQNFPANLYSNNILTFSGNDLPAIDFVNDVLLQSKNVKVRIDYGCGNYSTAMTLIPLLSAPEIVSVESTPPSCSYTTDGKLTVVFNRSLYANETITFSLDGMQRGPLNIDQLSADNKVTIQDLESLTDQRLTLNGSFNGRPTYAEDPIVHTKLVTVPVRKPITFTATEAAAHCFSGEDGVIAITALGGTGNYTAFLLQNGQVIQTITLTESFGNSFYQLKAGTYTIKVQDSNGCDPQNGSGQVIMYERTIAEPAERVAITVEENVEPLGYGLKNGHITIRAQGGTMPYTFYWTDSDGNPLTADATQTEGNSQVSTLSNLGKGTYYVRVQDTNYALASPQTETNQSGCYQTVTIQVDEPPLLKVSITEQHFVSCNGYSDGELVAQATGGRPYASNQTHYPYQYEWFVVDNNSLTAFGESDSMALERPTAVYRVRVTDRNGIIAWSSDFHLVQPDVLKINFTASELLCNGDANGIATAIPQGGTPPYRYAWSTEQTTSTIKDLTDGWYSVVVTDSRGCTAIGQTQITVPDGLKVDASVVQPTCFSDHNGSISLMVTGGKVPYQYQWKHGVQTASAQNLGQGEYEVKVTDANGCFLIKSYSLLQPDLLPVKLGPDRVLCKDQILELNGTINDPNARYQWMKDGVSFANTATVQLIAAGTYTLIVTDSKGCTNEDTIKISRDDTEIAADFVVATRVPKGERVHISNISYPAPDRIEWIVPSGTEILDQQQPYLEIQFDQFGEYQIGLRSFKGACEKIVYKTVRAVDKSELTDYQTPDEPYIKQFMVSPNPSNGKFTATVELKEKADFTLVLYSSQGQVIAQKDIRNQSFSETVFEETPAIQTGIYLLQLVTPQALATFKIISK